MGKVRVEFLKFILKVHIIGLCIFLFFRGILMVTERSAWAEIRNKWAIMGQTWWMGLRFDHVIACYILALPLVLGLVIPEGWWVRYRGLLRGITLFLITTYALAFFICAADIPYFNQFLKRMDASVFNWARTPAFVLKMIFQEVSYWKYLLVFFLLLVGFSRTLLQLERRFYAKAALLPVGKTSMGGIWKRILISLLLLLFCFIGIRGRLEKKSPIRVGTAFFSEYPIPNQLALNPVFSFLRSVLDGQKSENDAIHIIPEADALHMAAQSLGVPDSQAVDNPVLRAWPGDSAAPRLNVVLILMEGMSAHNMRHFGQKADYTPFLDSLYDHCYAFDRVYSAGIHTMNGIYGTLYGFPALYRQHPMDQVGLPNFDGLAGNLKNLGYQTVFFTTHDAQFDNASGFLMQNGFQKIISESDYPSDKVLSTLGVPDDYLFEYSMPVLDKMAATGQPFFAAMLTASNHGPYTIPDYFHTPFTDPKEQVLAYSDWALRRFFALCAEKPWFDQTLFVLIADHGARVGEEHYEMPLSYNHVPLMLFSKNRTAPRRITSLGQQIDVFPTVMGFLQLPYRNNTLGIDLLREKRPFAFFCADDKVGCVDEEWLFIASQAQGDFLHRYQTGARENFIKTMNSRADSMRNYAFSMMQTAQWMIKNKKTGKN